MKGEGMEGEKVSGLRGERSELGERLSHTPTHPHPHSTKHHISPQNPTYPTFPTAPIPHYTKYIYFYTSLHEVSLSPYPSPLALAGCGAPPHPPIPLIHPSPPIPYPMKPTSHNNPFPLSPTPTPSKKFSSYTPIIHSLPLSTKDPQSSKNPSINYA